MRALPIEEWINQNHFNQNSIKLIEEAVVCYRSGAYRAALLFSHLFFTSVVKQRILSTENPPNGMQQPEWDAIHRNLRTDEVWDTKVLEYIKRAKGALIFIITDDLKSQVEYWKNRRNDCAHAKSNIIDFSHVEAYWMFLISNLPKFVVNGSKDGLISKIRDHFDPNKTTPGKSFAHLVLEVPSAVEDSEIDDFCSKLYETLDDLDGWFHIFDKTMLSFWNALLDLNLQHTINAIVKLFFANQEAVVTFLNEYPNKAYLFKNDPVGIRNIWMKELFNYGHSNDSSWNLLATFLRNGFIDQDDYPLLLKKLDGLNLPINPPKPEIYPYLEQIGYIDDYKNRVFGQKKLTATGNFDFVNRNQAMLLSYIENCQLDVIVVEQLKYIIDNMYFGFVDSLEELFQKNHNKKSEYDLLVSQI